MKIAIDQDSVLADLHAKWLRVYNEEWNDNLTVNDIADWDITQFVRVECGNEMLRMLERDGFFADLPVLPGAQEGVRKLVDAGFEVCIASASIKTAYGDKHRWLEKHFPFLDPERFVFTKDKSLVCADVLIDDGLHNLEAFRGAYPIVFVTPWNKYDQRFVRLNGWHQVDWLISYLRLLANKQAM